MYWKDWLKSLAFNVKALQVQCSECSNILKLLPSSDRLRQFLKSSMIASRSEPRFSVTEFELRSTSTCATQPIMDTGILYLLFFSLFLYNSWKDDASKSKTSQLLRMLIFAHNDAGKSPDCSEFLKNLGFRFSGQNRKNRKWDRTCFGDVFSVSQKTGLSNRCKKPTRQNRLREAG